MVEELSSEVIWTMRLQLAQWNMCAIVTGLASTKVDRDHDISTLQPGQMPDLSGSLFADDARQKRGPVTGVDRAHLGADLAQNGVLRANR